MEQRERPVVYVPPTETDCRLSARSPFRDPDYLALRVEDCETVEEESAAVPVAEASGAATGPKRHSAELAPDQRPSSAGA